MLPASVALSLPYFDQAQVDKRFLTELDRLLQADVFATYKQWTETVGVSASYVNGIAAGRYHASLKLLYATVRAFPSFDFNYVVFGSAVYARPEPSEVPKRARGPRVKV
ncbi:MAG: hypothetical protein EOO62_01955 [Hymenobacter sp.]|nr:MAG: hypothetical protein EOO62_01955 [Hymenobacter sp.]